jgi:2-keto-4-pentenoate hydratase/2-oxohepta-3-ene-1,7-dioic acid hydratase in catechol pathway
MFNKEPTMKLVRYGRPGQEKPGLVDADGALRDLSRVVKDVTPDVLTPAGLKRLRGVEVARLPVVRGWPRLGCPLAGLGKMVCIGLNYTDHAEEVGLALPKEPPSSSRRRARCAAPTTRSSGPGAPPSSTTRWSWPR